MTPVCAGITGDRGPEGASMKQGRSRRGVTDNNNHLATGRTSTTSTVGIIHQTPSSTAQTLPHLQGHYMSARTISRVSAMLRVRPYVRRAGVQHIHNADLCVSSR